MTEASLLLIFQSSALANHATEEGLELALSLASLGMKVTLLFKDLALNHYEAKLDLAGRQVFTQVLKGLAWYGIEDVYSQSTKAHSSELLRPIDSEGAHELIRTHKVTLFY